MDLRDCRLSELPGVGANSTSDSGDRGDNDGGELA
jgi:hypothetical protein